MPAMDREPIIYMFLSELVILSLFRTVLGKGRLEFMLTI